eukprot:TRINITY_DN5967_c0_g2_i1.p1 TRINITY_DN5967_c0_g2~~TRINITY_DN5967_c0_g2_i1.p1  ORF type:complete len:389 (-),score=91.26 TRINITY_DN5967_c0_g2_i1:297-1463(-)
MFVTALRRCAPRRPIHLIQTADQCRNVVDRLLRSDVKNVAVDCEGALLGRFGGLALVQLATDRDVFLVDVVLGGGAVVEPLTPLMQSRELVKVFHDCREDASTLLHQYGVPLAAVFDTQVGFMTWLERQNLEPYQASVGETLRTFQQQRYRAHRWDELEKRHIAPQRWQQRPLDAQAVRYAVEGVAHLLPLQRAICRELGDPNGELVLRRGANYVDYARLNSSELPSEDLSVLRPGLPLKAMLATRKPDSLYFKLNRAPLAGAVLDETDLRDFVDLRPGDVAACRVKFVSDCQQFVHLQREGHGNLVYDRTRREMRTLPSQEELDEHRPRRQSSFYGLGLGGDSGGPGGLEEEPRTYQERAPEVIYKKGGRGAVKVKKNAFQPPKRKG